MRRRLFGISALSLLVPLALPAPGLGKTASEKATAVKSAAAHKSGSVLPFLEDDAAGAEVEARKLKRLLFVDFWASWCHTCMSMKNFVLTDPSLAPMRDSFVFLSVDTENPENTAFVERYPVTTWPTIMVIDPAAGPATAPVEGQAGQAQPSGQVVARWTGAMTAPELLARMTEVRNQTEKTLLPLRLADEAAAAGRYAEARDRYAQAMHAPQLKARAQLGHVQALYELGDAQTCAQTVDSMFTYDQVPHSAAATDLAAYGAGCLDKLKNVDLQSKLRRRLRDKLEALVRETNAALLPDDRSDGLGTLTELADALGDKAGGDRYAEERLALLEPAARAEKSPSAAATYDAHRLEAYLRLKRYVPAEAMLRTSQKAMPTDYNPPARLARLYHEMGRLGEAQKMIDRALSLASGPRRVRMYELRSSIEQGLGHPDEAVASLEAALAIVDAQNLFERRNRGAKAGSATRLAEKAENLKKGIAALRQVQAANATDLAQSGRQPTTAKTKTNKKLARRDGR